MKIFYRFLRKPSHLQLDWRSIARSASNTVRSIVGIPAFAGMTCSLLVIATATVLLSGCATDNTPKPTPLSHIAPTAIQVDTVWHASTGDGADGHYFTMGPAVTDGVVYTDDANGRVTAMNLVTGKRIWRTQLKATLSTTPVVAADTVLVGSRGGRLMALNTVTGKTLWTTQLTSVLLSPPAVADGIAVVHTHDGNVAAYNLVTGRRLWLHDGSTPGITLEMDSQPVIHDGLVIVGFANGVLAAFKLHTGVLVWQHTIAYPSGDNAVANMVDIDSTPIVKYGVIYVVAYHGNLAAINLKTGQSMWQHPISAYRDLAYAHGSIVMTSESGQVWAFNARTGQQLWVQNAFKHRYVSAPTVFNNRYVVVGDYAGYVHFLSLQTGKLLARVRVSHHAIRAKAVVVGQHVLAMSINGQLAVLHPLSFKEES